MTEKISADFLLYPFAMDIVSNQRVGSWKRLIRDRARAKNNLFFIIQHDGFDLRSFSPEQRKVVQDFILFAKRTLNGRVVVIKERDFLALPKSFFDRKGIGGANSVHFRWFGISAGLCTHGGAGEILKKMKVFYPQKAFSDNTLLSQSRLSNSLEAQKIFNAIGKRKPELLANGGELTLLRMLVDGGLTYRMALRQLQQIKHVKELGPKTARRTMRV